MDGEAEVEVAAEIAGAEAGHAAERAVENAVADIATDLEIAQNRAAHAEEVAETLLDAAWATEQGRRVAAAEQRAEDAWQLLESQRQEMLILQSQLTDLAARMPSILPASQEPVTAEIPTVEETTIAPSAVEVVPEEPEPVKKKKKRSWM